MTDDEKYVREHIDKPWPLFDQWPSVFIEWTDADYRQAAKVLRTRLQQIRERQLDCEVLQHFADDQDGSYQGKAFERILAREQAALADLKRGLKGS